MIGIDTNILVRYIAQDDEIQTPIADAFLSTLTNQKPGFIATVAVVELVWVFETCYQATRKQVAETLITLLRLMLR